MTLISYVLIALLGLIIGSFLNVVIYRLPIMMKREWEPNTTEPPLDLCLPRSQCPHCHTPLNIRHNIPLLGFILLKGCCYHCHERISWRYPFIELASALLAVICFWRFGLSYAMIGALIFSWGLLTASAIDIAEKFIPDSITLPLLWLGLIANAFSFYTSPASAILGAAVGYLLFWSIAKLFLIIRKKEGLGYGDFKLLAMLAAWLGMESIVSIILLASISGIIISVLLMLNKKLKPADQIPFGPFLALAGWYTMMFGSVIAQLLK